MDHTNRGLRIGLTEAHGLATELAASPPPGVSYSFISPRPARRRFITSPIKGYLGHFDADDVDLIEAVLSPIFTSAPWLYSLAGIHQALAFGVFGIPVPRTARIALIKRLFLQDNFKKLIFRSQAGRQTLHDYKAFEDPRVLAKVDVVYPGVREAPDDLVRFRDTELTLLFTGDFFRKGGVNVIDAFERAQKRYASIKLVLCCDERIDFNTPNQSLRAEYLAKIGKNPAIVSLGRVPRERVLQDVLPSADIFLIPTYTETFGFAILEAMAYGLPIIATNHFAIPEMLEHGTSGFLIDTNRFDCGRLFRGYVVNEIPPDFRAHVTDQLYAFLCPLIESIELRKRIGMAALGVARTKFSVDHRNTRLVETYRAAVQ